MTFIVASADVSETFPRRLRMPVTSSRSPPEIDSEAAFTVSVISKTPLFTVTSAVISAWCERRNVAPSLTVTPPGVSRIA